MKHLKNKKIAICGYRKYGRKLFQELKKRQIEVACIIERNYESLRVTEDIEVPIVGFDADKIYGQAELLIITPDLDYELVQECLEIAEVKIPQIKMTDIIMEQ